MTARQALLVAAVCSLFFLLLLALAAVNQPATPAPSGLVAPRELPLRAARSRPLLDAGVVSTPKVRRPRTVSGRGSRNDRPAPASNSSRVLSVNWTALADCESSGNPRAVDTTGTYFGLYQFDLTTWRSVGGSGNPADASPAEQTYRACLLYDERGRSPWPICGRYL